MDKLGAHKVDLYPQVSHVRPAAQGQLGPIDYQARTHGSPLGGSENPSYQRRIKRWEKKEGGEKVLVEKPLRTSKWWQQDPCGACVMTMKVGSKRIEFERDNAAIAVGSLENLPSVIDALIKAVRTGELDEQLKSAKGPRSVPARKVAYPCLIHSA